MESVQPTITINFRRPRPSAGGRPRGLAGGCGGMAFSVQGKPQFPLANGSSLIRHG